MIPLLGTYLKETKSLPSKDIYTSIHVHCGMIHSHQDMETTSVSYSVWMDKNMWSADDTTLMAESEEELKSLLMKVKEESEKVGFKLNIQKMKIMASGPITSWEIDGETVETVSDFIFGGAPKSLQMVTAAMKLKDAYSLEGKLWPT